ncbi:hypothetical protein DNH61_17400 [Paenibacillus sambharensis]|uniref:HPt domain-containing protein n=1 Tax=Paenibacillus sambharensis TaxID=1803190 RepID=A0A2W1LIJ7_9BACL|nr:Hpt domain-containing protein [Paenibacillus sambharensis]PZD94725.1 hypothetical protein DNH61_17400 [Paenibacillus sambharensis]
MQQGDLMDPGRVEMLKEWLGSTELFITIIQSFLEQSCNALMQLEQDGGRMTNEQWTDAVHKLKGMASNVGATALVDLGEQLESASYEGQPLTPGQKAAFMSLARSTLEMYEAYIR